MRKLIIAATVAASLAVPAVSMADAPVSGVYNWNTNAAGNGSVIGVDSSQIKQNGPWVSQTQATSATGVPGSRGALVQSLLGH